MVTKKCWYTLKLENDQLLQTSEFVQFCVDNQHKDIVLQVINEGHCLTYCGVYNILDMFKFNSVKLITSNVLEKHNLYTIDSSKWNFWFTNIKDFDFSYDYTWNLDKVFGCFYGRPCAPRLGIAAHLIKYHKDISQVRIKLDFSSNEARKLFDLQRLFSWHPEALSLVHNLNNAEYIGEQDYQKGNYTWNNPLKHLYKNFLIDLVSEPVCYGTTFYPTEKIVRAILCRRPFIVMSSVNYLEYLRQMGFHTFNEFWDETYDGYEGADRYFKILSLIDTLSSKSKKELQDLYNFMQFQIDHNHNLIVNKLYSKKITLIE